MSRFMYIVIFRIIIFDVIMLKTFSFRGPLFARPPVPGLPSNKDRITSTMFTSSTLPSTSSTSSSTSSSSKSSISTKAPLLLDNYLPPVMQALAYYIELLQYEQIDMTTLEPPLNLEEVQMGTTYVPASSTTPPPDLTSTTKKPFWQPATTTQRPSTTTIIWWKPPATTSTTKATTTKATTTKATTTKATTTSTTKTTTQKPSTIWWQPTSSATESFTTDNPPTTWWWQSTTTSTTKSPNHTVTTKKPSTIWWVAPTTSSTLKPTVWWQASQKPTTGWWQTTTSTRKPSTWWSITTNKQKPTIWWQSTTSTRKPITISWWITTTKRPSKLPILSDTTYTTPFHKPGLFAPNPPSMKLSSTTQINDNSIDSPTSTEKISTTPKPSNFNENDNDDNEKKETNFPTITSDKNFIEWLLRPKSKVLQPDTEYDFQLLDPLPASLIHDILDERYELPALLDSDNIKEFLRIYDDTFGRYRPLTGKKKVPITKPYVEFLLLYDLLKREAKSLNLNKYEGYTPRMLQELVETSTRSAERQLHTLMTRMLVRNDVKRTEIIRRVKSIIKDLENPESSISKALRYIPPLKFIL